MRRGDGFGVIGGAVAYGVAHAGGLPALVYWPLTEAWSWSWGGAGGVSMRYYGLLLWAGAGYGLGLVGARLLKRGVGDASARVAASAFSAVALVMVYVLVAEVGSGH